MIVPAKAADTVGLAGHPIKRLINALDAKARLLR
jgi:hypothetical protein